MLKKLRDKVKNCKKCGNNRHYEKNKRLVRCPCYNTAFFISYFDNANGSEDYVIPEYVDKIKSLMAKHDVAAIVALKQNERLHYTHSAIYLGARHLLHTEIYNDQDIRDTVFNEAGVEPRKFSQAIYEAPDFLILKLCTIKNTNFLSRFINQLIENRINKKKKTLLILPAKNCIKNCYGDEDLNEFIFETLEHKKSLYTHYPKDFEE